MLTALFCGIASALYTVAQVEPAPVVVLFVGLGPVIAVVLWMQSDARRNGVSTVQDWGFLVWLFWPVMIPWYAWKTRGPAGWRLTLGLFTLLGAPFIGWFLAACAVYSVQLIRQS